MKWWGWGDENIAFSPEEKPGLTAFIQKTFNYTLGTPTVPMEFDHIELASPHLNKTFLDDIKASLGDDQISLDKTERVVHAYGKSYRDLWRMRRGIIERAPDCVIYPETEKQIITLLASAAQHDVIVIVFGGGSNIVGGVEPVARNSKMVVSLDMKRMQQLLTLDNHSFTAKFQAGVTGPFLEKQLNEHGFTLGHFPDSFEYSTLGGWVATRSAGMQSDEYGKIEEMVISLRAVTPEGLIETRVVPSAANGINLNHILIGSEGTLGVITEVTVQIHHQPAVRYPRGFLFKDFQSGLDAMYECASKGLVPSMTRLNDAAKTQLSFAFKSKASPLKATLNALFKHYLQKMKHFDLNECCLMLNIFQGDKADTIKLRKSVTAIYKKHGAVDIGESAGVEFEKGKYDFPYIRDYCMDHDILADVSETATTWQNIYRLYQAGCKSIKEAMAHYDNHHFVGCHISHTYHTGGSLYFTFAAREQKENGLKQYLDIKQSIETCFIQHGASVSHHHAVGYEHMPWLEEDITSLGVRTIKSIKQNLDPTHIMNPGKLIPEQSVLDKWHKAYNQRDLDTMTSSNHG